MIETENLLLKSGSKEDWADLYEHFWSHDEAFAGLFQKPCQTPKAAQKKAAAYAAMHREVPTEFFVYEKSSGKAIGVAGLKPLEAALFTVTDIAIGPDFWGKGYGKQILLALTTLAADLGAHRVLYNCFQQNIPSRRLAQSCGYRYFKTEKAELTKNGENVLLDYFEYTI